MAEKGLGKGVGAGLGALFGDDIINSGAENILELPMSKVEPRADQPRSTFDEVALGELAESLRTYGLIQPITVRKLDTGYYQIIAGERRWRAAKQAGFDKIPARVMEDVNDKKATEIALVENLQREDLNPIEEALGYKTLVEEYGLTQEQAAQSVGKSRPAVANALRILRLSQPVLKLVEDNSISAGHARALLALDGVELQLSVARNIMEQDLSVRQTEALVSRIAKENQLGASGLGRKRGKSEYVVDLEKQLASLLGRKVSINEGQKKGKIEMEFYSRDDMEDLIEKLLAK